MEYVVLSTRTRGRNIPLPGYMISVYFAQPYAVSTAALRATVVVGVGHEYDGPKSEAQCQRRYARQYESRAPRYVPCLIKMRSYLSYVGPEDALLALLVDRLLRHSHSGVGLMSTVQ